VSDSIKIALGVFVPFLIFGGLIFLTSRLNRKRQILILIPVLLAADIWLGISNVWRWDDWLQLGITLFIAIAGGFLEVKTSRALHRRNPQP
jgi:hypothetical protein